LDRKIILWSLALFFGCSILFGAIKSTTTSAGLALAIQAAVALALIAVVVLVWRKKR
jgi:Ca2+/H+ antiporter